MLTLSLRLKASEHIVEGVTKDSIQGQIWIKERTTLLS